MRSVSLLCWTWGWQLSGLPAGEGGATQVTGEGRSLLQIKLHIVGKLSFPFF